ncbi:MAG: hypothetical protein FWD80_04285, partial [Propionibacteriaceae bacterium]|nr:hypothetical protein [Propionibacteriaceae bacterium]
MASGSPGPAGTHAPQPLVQHERGWKSVWAGDTAAARPSRVATWLCGEDGVWEPWAGWNPRAPLRRYAART